MSRYRTIVVAVTAAVTIAASFLAARPAAASTSSRTGANKPSSIELMFGGLPYTPRLVKTIKRPGRPEISYFNFINQGSNKCLDLKNNNTSNGAVIQQWTCLGNNNQLWATPFVGSWNWGGFTWSKLHITPHDNGNMCIDATNNGTGNGTLLQLWSCFSNPIHDNQSWVEMSTPNNTTNLVNVKATNARNTEIVMDVISSGSDHGTANGDRIQLWQLTTGLNQQWAW
jgi:hypothetical protein